MHTHIATHNLCTPYTRKPSFSNDGSAVLMPLCLYRDVAGIFGAVGGYRDKLLALEKDEELGGPDGLKATIIVPTASMKGGVLVERTFRNVTTAEGKTITVPIDSQVWTYMAVVCRNAQYHQYSNRM